MTSFMMAISLEQPLSMCTEAINNSVCNLLMSLMLSSYIGFVFGVISSPSAPSVFHGMRYCGLIRTSATAINAKATINDNPFRFSKYALMTDRKAHPRRCS